MKTLSYISLLAFLCAPQLCSQWIQQTWPTTDPLRDVYFATPQVGIVTGYLGEIFRTSDGGTTWQKQSIWPVTSFHTRFITSQLGWGVGGTVGNHGAILRTTNGGHNWSVQDSSFEKIYFQGVSFVDALYGWVVASASYPDTAGRMFRTTDGGSTWIQVAAPNLAWPNDVCFVDRQQGWAVGQYGGIVKTTDGGVTWIEVARAFITRSTGPQTEPLRKVWFVDPNHGWAVGGITGVETKMRTTDGGMTWVTDNIPMGGSSLQGLWFNDASNGWTVGGGVGGPVVKHTTDGGVTWTKQSIPWTKGNLQDVCMTGANEGWVVGDYGMMMKTTNGGVTSVGEGPGNIPGEFALHQNYPNPFNPNTAISFQLLAISDVNLKVLDILGREVVTLVNGVVEPGTHNVSWDGRNSKGDPQSSGIYFYTLSTDERTITRKMVLLK